MMKSIRRMTIVVAVAFAATCIAQNQPTGAEDHFQRSFSLQPGSAISVKNYKGLIRIEPTESGRLQQRAQGRLLAPRRARRISDTQLFLELR